MVHCCFKASKVLKVCLIEIQSVAEVFNLFYEALMKYDFKTPLKNTLFKGYLMSADDILTPDFFLVYCMDFWV